MQLHDLERVNKLAAEIKDIEQQRRWVIAGLVTITYGSPSRVGGHPSAPEYAVKAAQMAMAKELDGQLAIRQQALNGLGVYFAHIAGAKKEPTS